MAGLYPGEGVTTTYLLNPLTGQTAQDNSTYRSYIAGVTLLHGNSANAVLDQYVDPILGCTPFEAPDLSNASVPAFSEALDADSGWRRKSRGPRRWCRRTPRWS